MLDRTNPPRHPTRFGSNDTDLALPPSVPAQQCPQLAATLPTPPDTPPMPSPTLPLSPTLHRPDPTARQQRGSGGRGSGIGPPSALKRNSDRGEARVHIALPGAIAEPPQRTAPLETPPAPPHKRPSGR